MVPVGELMIFVCYACFFCLQCEREEPLAEQDVKVTSHAVVEEDDARSPPTYRDAVAQVASE